MSHFFNGTVWGHLDLLIEDIVLCGSLHSTVLKPFDAIVSRLAWIVEPNLVNTVCNDIS